jgi:hypothetical protein
VAALTLVLEPLVRGGAGHSDASSQIDDLDFTDIEESESPKVQALLALKEIEFDRATGKLSDKDYSALKLRYAKVALTAIKVEDEAAAGAQGAKDDAAEAAIQRAREGTVKVCPTCGPRPEVDSAFCSSCGKPLVSPGGTTHCSSCSEAIPAGGKFCANCGAAVGALVGD